MTLQFHFLKYFPRVKKTNAENTFAPLFLVQHCSQYIKFENNSTVQE